MNLWYKKSLVFVAAAVAYLAGQYFRGVWLSPTWPFPCQLIHSGSTAYCYAPYLDTLGWPLMALGEALAITAVVLLFANERGFRKWLRFSYFYLPLAAVLSIYLSTLRVPLGSTIELWGPVRFFGLLYALITAGIVLYARLRPGPKGQVAAN